MHLLKQILGSLACILAAVAPRLAAEPSLRSGPVEAELRAEHTTLRPGATETFALRLRMDTGWHTYGEQPGEAGLPTEITWELPAGFVAGPLVWPEPETFSSGGVTTSGYSGEVVLLTSVAVPATAAVGSPATLRAHVSWLACSDQCMPGAADFTISLPIESGGPVADATAAALFAAARARSSGDSSASSAVASGSLVTTIFSALLGGLILNLMPCVFPVIGIKIMGFVHQSGSDRRKVTIHGLVFTAGVLVSFWALAGMLLILRAGGQHLGWGFQLQSPLFVFGLAVFLFAFGLSMSGVFEFGLGATSVGSSLQARSGYAGSFFTGVLVTVVSTPCAAPFLAPALGAALALPPLSSIVLFTAIALGLSLPYLILSAFPRLVKLLPRPGVWMETFKQVMAFPLYGTVAFLVWVLAGQLEADALFAALGALVLVALSAWVYGRWGQRGEAPGARRAGLACAAAAFAVAAFVGFPRSHAGAITWQDWSPERVAALRAEGRTIYVDFTARWCATCKMNKLAVFSSDEIARVFSERGIVPLRADWTNRDPKITAGLAEFGRSAVPCNVVYGPGSPAPILLPEVLSAGAVLEALDRAGDPSVTARVALH